MNDNIEIGLSKRKLTLLLFVSIAFVATGCWLLINPPFEDKPVYFKIAGIASVVFFGICSILIAKRISENRLGLIINKQGIIDYSSAASAGLIKWQDIEEIRETQVMDQKFLLIMVRNPEEYINRQNSSFKRYSMSLNYKSYGSPVNISANGLRISFNELKEIVTGKFSEYHQKITGV